MTVLQMYQNVSPNKILSFFKKKSPEFNNQIQIDQKRSFTQSHPVKNSIGKAHAKSTRTKLHTILTTTSRHPKDYPRNNSKDDRSSPAASEFPPPIFSPPVITAQDLLDDRRSLSFWTITISLVDSHLRDTSINRSLVRSLCFSSFFPPSYACTCAQRLYLSVAGERNVGERKERR